MYSRPEEFKSNRFYTYIISGNSTRITEKEINNQMPRRALDF